MARSTLTKYQFLAVTRFALPMVLAGCASHRPQVRLPDAAPGVIQFQSYCAACHQYDGQKMGDAPALAGSPWVNGPEDRLIKIVLHGVRGPMVVDGKIHDREMPGFGQILSDSEVASLLTYVRAQFGASSEPVTAETVRRIRASHQTRTQYWHVDELLEKP